MWLYCRLRIQVDPRQWVYQEIYKSCERNYALKRQGVQKPPNMDSLGIPWTPDLKLFDIKKSF